MTNTSDGKARFDYDVEELPATMAFCPGSVMTSEIPSADYARPPRSKQRKLIV